MKRYKLLILSLLSSIILTSAWPARGFPILMFFAFIPLLFIEDYITRNKHNFVKSSFFLYSYLTFFVWNLLTTWWIYYSSLFGVIMAVVFNSLFMAIVFHFYHMTRRNLFKNVSGFFTIIFYWITFEFLHMNWDLTWSWLNLGNSFANYPELIQWYENTGTLGGTTWILLINILIFLTLKYRYGNIKMTKRVTLYGASAILLIIIPLTLSLIRFYTYKETDNSVDIVVVQPNIDPYNEKFGGMSSAEQLDKIIRLSYKEIDSNTEYLICPETCIPEGIIEDELDNSKSIDSLRTILKKYQNLKIVIGISSFKIFKKGEKLTETARFSEPGKYYYDVCNSALFLDTSDNYQIYHKSKLVPGVEKMPYPKLFRPLEKYALDLGGMTGSYGIQEERSVFSTKNDKIKIAPVICYESIYGDFVSEYIRNGANIIFIITNDGWWGNTGGHKQHFEYARLRAVETRRSIARSANTGISGFINQKGEILQTTKYWEDDVIRYKINANSQLTFYSKFGDYIGRFSQYITYILIILYLVMLFMNKRYRNKHIQKKSL